MTENVTPRRRGGYKGGSRKGVPNKATHDARAAIALFVEQNTPRLQGWLDEIATTKGPDAAFRCVQELLEYHVPKLARTELVGDKDQPVQTVVKHVYEEAEKGKP